MLCNTVTERPGPDMFRAILFPVKETSPRFIWIPRSDFWERCSLRESEPEAECSTDLDPTYGVPYYDPDETIAHADFKAIFPGSMDIKCIVLGNINNGKLLDHGIHAVWNDEFQLDGSPFNECLVELFHDRCRPYWRDNVVLYGLSKNMEAMACKDLDVGDLTIGVDALVHLTRGYQLKEPYSFLPKEEKKIKGVVVNASDRSFQEVNISAQHPIFDPSNSEVAESTFFNHAGLPLHVYKSSFPSYTKQGPNRWGPHSPAAFLFMEINDASSGTASSMKKKIIPKEWAEIKQRVLLVRRDRKPLDPAVIEFACDFLQQEYQLSNLLAESDVSTAIQDDDDDASADLTEEKFAHALKRFLQERGEAKKKSKDKDKGAFGGLAAMRGALNGIVF